MMKVLIQFFVLTILSFSSCHPKMIDQSSVSQLEDGIYLVRNTFQSKPSQVALKKGELMVQYNYRFEDKTAQNDKYLILVKEEYVPLTLKEKPEAIEQKDKRKKLYLHLTQNAKERLKDFTTKHLNQRTAIVIKGEAVTLHKIKSVIDGGLLQITRCTDNACEFLYAELQDNVAPEPKDTND